MEGSRTFAESIKTAHKKSGLSLAEFARRIDTPLSTLHHIFQGGEPTLDTSLHIAKNLNVFLSTLTGEITDEEDADKLSIYLSTHKFYSTLEKEDKREVRECFRGILDSMSKREAYLSPEKNKQNTSRE